MTTVKTKQDFLKNCSNPELAKKTLKQGGVSWSEITERPADFYDPSSGSVFGMIYYKDTVKFAKANHLLILQALEDFENETGEKLDKPNTQEETQYFNWLAWFAWENTMGEVIRYLEQ